MVPRPPKRVKLPAVVMPHGKTQAPVEPWFFSAKSVENDAKDDGHLGVLHMFLMDDYHLVI